MRENYNILILGASYGSLLGMKFVLAGHDVTLMGLPAEVEAFNREGATVRIPVAGRRELLEINSRQAPGKLSAAGPGALDPRAYDLVALAMQEPQYRAAAVHELLGAVARVGVPCMSIMNMPPLPYLRRVPGIDAARCRDCYTDPSVWDAFDPELMTLCSPDPQAFRPSPEEPNVLQVRLPTNFKTAGFASDTHTAVLARLAADIDAIRMPIDGERREIPVKLKVHRSVFVPLAKWSMLLAGNYRCVQEHEPRTIRDAVHGDIGESRAVYEWVCAVCKSLGASASDLVPFEKYANAALSLASPSSAARALFGGAQHIERVDRLVQLVAAQRGLQSDVVDNVVALVDARLEMNRTAAREARCVSS